MSAQNPIVTFDGTVYTVTIFRNGIVAFKNTFEKYSLTVIGCRQSDVPSAQRAKIWGAPADDGFLYFIHAKYIDKGFAFSELDMFEWLEDKEEALAMIKAIHDAEWAWINPDRHRIVGLEEEAYYKVHREWIESDARSHTDLDLCKDCSHANWKCLCSTRVQ